MITKKKFVSENGIQVLHQHHQLDLKKVKIILEQ